MAGEHFLRRTDLERPRSCAFARHHPSGHQAAERHHPARRHREADRFRHRVLRDDAGDARGAGGHRLGALYLARAGQGQQDRLPHGYLFARRGHVRDADRQAPVRGRDRAPNRHAAYQRRAADAERAGPGHPEGTGRHRHARDVREHQQTLCFGGRAVRRPCARARGPGHTVLLYCLGRQLGRDAGHRTGGAARRPSCGSGGYGRHPGGTAPPQ